ncbi:carbonic anhydrase [Streptomyces sp. IBSNAI002]|uniref:carbonic anhydrase n=1 Tax=Streptomyces sp. IBSNAI002 TaxID=3457500 RepID=UPI003FD1862B
MQPFTDHVRGFAARNSAHPQALASLAREHRPLAALVTCSDARVVPSLITGARPGELFELRTAGNVVPPYRRHAVCAVAASLEFAVEQLRLPDLIVCGHSHCAAVRCLLRRRPGADLPLLHRWLAAAAGYRRPAEGPLPPGPADEHLAGAAQRHVLTQLEHLRTYPWVERRVRAGQLRLHAWYYTVETGQTLAARVPGASTFEAL